jgi:hypothetical protein
VSGSRRRAYVKYPRGGLYAVVDSRHHGRLATEEFERWRGREPKLPDHLRRWRVAICST